MNNLDDNKRKAAGLLALLLSVAGTSYAQDEEVAADEPKSMVLDEVIVTARKREETLQESPVAISALSADALKEAGIANTRDLQQAVPGLNFTEQGSKNPSIFIRGVGARESNAALDPGVGVYINGIYIPRTDGQLLDTVDTESVQVLRGPQGTLFGKNNTGGAMLITTQAPHNEALEGYVTTRLGNFGRRDLKASANIPLNDDTLAARVGVNSTKSDGYLKNFDGNEYGDEDRLAATARVLWQATDTFSADVFTYWSKQNERGSGFNCRWAGNEGTPDPNDFSSGADYNSVLFPVVSGNAVSFASYKDACRDSEALSDKGKISINGPSVFKMESAISALTLAWDFDDLEIKSITAYSKQWNILAEDDQDGTSLTALGNGRASFDLIMNQNPQFDVGDEERSQMSQELQAIGSAFDESLSYTVGLFYSNEQMDNNAFTQLVGYNGYSQARQGPLNFLLPKFLGTVSSLENEAYAVFAQGTYDINDYVQLTLGARYTVENREREASVFSALLDRATLTSNPALQALNPGWENASVYEDVISQFGGSAFGNLVSGADYSQIANPNLTLPVYLSSNETDDKTFRKFTPMGTLSMKVPESLLENTNFDSLMTYITVSQGFKAGGFEPKGTELEPFDPEKVTNVEIGIKADAFGQRVRFNTAVYRMDYEDIQVRVAQSGENLGDILLYISNAGSATIQGVEMELTALVTDGLTIAATANYTDSFYDEFEGLKADRISGVNSAFDRSREPFGSTPPFTFSLTAMYDLDTDIGLFIPRLTAFYRDEIYTGVDLAGAEYEDAATLDAVTLWNFRMAYIPADLQELNVSLFVKNLTDEKYFQGGFTVAETLGAAILTQGPGREYGIEATYNF
jgi:iron complex outermembrane recepter protein